jgi:PAP2 superfamily
MAAASEPVTRRSLREADVEARSRRWTARLRPLLDLALVAWLIWLFDAVNNLAPVRQALAVRDGGRVLALERSLHLAPEHALNTWLSAQPALRQIVVFWYENVHIGMTLAVLGWLWWKRRDLLGVMEATLLLVSLVALAVFWSFPVAPPRMLPGHYVDLVASVHHQPVWQFGSVALHANQLCALPSLHVAWATWCSIAIWQMTRRTRVRTLAGIYPLLTTLAVMSTANHYLADSVSGAAITLVVFFALSRAAERRTGRLPAPARPSAV